MKVTLWEEIKRDLPHSGRCKSKYRVTSSGNDPAPLLLAEAAQFLMQNHDKGYRVEKPA